MTMALNQRIRSVLVVGGGVAGITAALDIADAGGTVHLVERSPQLGGQVARLDKLYPSDHCAFCRLWTMVARCLQHPCIRVYTGAEIQSIAPEDRSFSVQVLRQPEIIDPRRCIFCGRCLEACQGAISPLWPYRTPPAYAVDPAACNRCGACTPVCPTGAIDLDRRAEELRFQTDRVICATGFVEDGLTRLPEYGSGTHPDIMGSMEFEAWIAEDGPNAGRLVRRSDGMPPRHVAFVQCAGSRDLRLFDYCSAVCCMHALKQARWVKRRNPDVGCTIFYTDLRTVGKNYQDYAEEACSQDVELIRGRPGKILPLPEKGVIAMRYEDTRSRKRSIRAFDMVVLNGALEMSGGFSGNGISVTREVTGDSCPANGRSEISFCGFAKGPADVAESVIGASSCALRALLGA